MDKRDYLDALGRMKDAGVDFDTLKPAERVVRVPGSAELLHSMSEEDRDQIARLQASGVVVVDEAGRVLPSMADDDDLPTILRTEHRVGDDDLPDEERAEIAAAQLLMIPVVDPNGRVWPDIEPAGDETITESDIKAMLGERVALAAESYHCETQEVSKHGGPYTRERVWDRKHLARIVSKAL